MTKIANIEISDFRGFESVRTFDFEDADIVVFLGMNGFGKTSIFDAVEWCLTGHVSRYESYLTGGRKSNFAEEKKVLRNKYSNDPHSLVKIELTNGKKIGRRVMINKNGTDYGTGSIIDGFDFGVNGIAAQPIDEDVIHNYFSATHILSQETIHHFVTSKKPEDRYRAVSVNFGTSLYEPFNDNVQRLIATLKAKEEVKTRKIEETKIRLKDFTGQLQARADEMERLILESNQIIFNIKGIMPSIPLIDYIFDESQSKINGTSIESIKKILSNIKSEFDEISHKIFTLKSLSKDHASWVEQNKELGELDRRVIENKQLIIKIREAEANKTHLENESYKKGAELKEKLSDKNLLEFIHENFPKYLKIRNEVDQLRDEIRGRSDSSSDKQNRLTELTGRISSKEKKHKEVVDWLQIAGVLQKELKAFFSKDEHINQIKENRVVALKDIETNRKLVEKIQVINEEIMSNWSELDMEYINSLKNVGTTIDVSSLLEQMKKINEIKELKSNIDAKGDEKEKLKLDIESLAEDLNKTQAMLANALELISTEEAKSMCPVCDVPHDTQNLFNIIESKINSKKISSIDNIKKKISNIDGVIRTEREKYKDLKECCNNQKILYKKIIQEKIGSIKSSIAKDNLVFISLEEELQSHESEELRLSVKATSVLGIEDTKDLNEVASILSDKLSLKEKEKERVLDVLNQFFNRKMELEKDIETQLSANHLSQERITTILSESYERVDGFILDKGMTVDAHLPNKILSQLAELKEYCEKTGEEIQKLSEDRSAAILYMNELTKLKNESEIENDNLLISKRTNEISRFLSDYKERAMRIDIELGSVSVQSIGELISKYGIEQSKAKNIEELINDLLERARIFYVFSKEDNLRKKITDIDSKIDKLKIEKAKVNSVKKQIEGLRKKFPKILEKYITDNLDVKLFNQIYHSLNPHRRFKEIDFKVNVSYNKVGINFNATDFSLNAKPEFLFSSAQLNTLGVSMFLSMALRQNWLNLDTVLLDDPIQNLDDINVLSLIDLLRGLLDLKSKQIILSTHDERFYNLVKRKFSDYKLKAYRFESYGRVMPD